MTRSASAILVFGLLAPWPLAAAETVPGAQEVWSGIYRCGPMQTESGTAPGYSSSIRLTVEGTTARVRRQSGDIAETLQGEIARDGAVILEGTGARRAGGATWRYRYEGRFSGSRFSAEGAMLSANLATRLRECTMTLTRMQRSDASASERETKLAAAEQKVRSEPQAKPQAAAVPPERESAPAGSARKPRGAEAPLAVDKALDFRERNDSATMEGEVTRGAPHRYNVLAKKGQRLSATLQSEGGARFDLYEPGSSVSLLSGGFVVQGARLAANEEGTHVDTALPADGSYLLLVRAGNEAAFYALDLTVEGAAPTLWERWWASKKLWLATAAAGALALLVLILRRRKRARRMFGPD